MSSFVSRSYGGSQPFYNIYVNPIFKLNITKTGFFPEEKLGPDQNCQTPRDIYKRKTDMNQPKYNKNSGDADTLYLDTPEKSIIYSEHYKYNKKNQDGASHPILVHNLN